jgi:ATP-dependent Zn protease
VQTFFRSALFPLIVIVLLVYLASQTLMGDDATVRKVAYSEVQRVVHTRPETVDEVSFKPAERLVVLKLDGGNTLQARYPTNSARAALERDLVAQRGPAATSDDKGSSAWWSILTALLPFVLLFAFWLHLTRRADRRRAERAIPFGKDFRSDVTNQ